MQMHAATAVTPVRSSKVTSFVQHFVQIANSIREEGVAARR